MGLRIFDVEHGACSLLSIDDGQNLMIDCGHNASNGWMPGRHLQQFGIRSLDMLMITNYDEDHVSGFRDLDSRVTIDWLVRNTSVSAEALFELKSETGIGRSMEHLANRLDDFVPSRDPVPCLPNVSWEVYWNRFPMFLDENNLSMVVGLSLFDTHFLFPGDIERQGWLALLRDNPALRDFVRKTDVLLASHHGRENGICEEMFYQLGCNPSLVVISDDYHKYDTQQTVQYYKSIAKGIPFRGRNRWVLTTRNDGDIIFRFDDHGRCDIY